MSRRVRYFVTNEAVRSQAAAHALYDAIRGHWQVETMHYRRDVILAEDEYRSKFMSTHRVMSDLRTLAISLLHSLKPKNMAAQLNDFADNVQQLLDFLKLKRIL